MSTPDKADPELLVSTAGVKGRQIGVLTLNRPKALNALTYDMILEMDKALTAWEDDDSIEAVLVKGAGEKAFCAGGDVKQVYLAGKRGDLGKPGTLTYDFFADEYVLNAKIAAYKKPFISIWDGIVMGGGVGVSVMGSHRIGTEKTKFGMPETAIGFFPDVGGSYFLSRLGHIGTYLALTGQAITAGDAFKFGLATDFVPSDDLPGFIKSLETDGLEKALSRNSTFQTPKPEKAGELTALANAHFNKETMEEIFSSLEAAKTELAEATLTLLKSRSPAAMKVTLKQLQLGRDLGFNECLKMEFRICQQALKHHDFYEGIRAVLIDKDKAAKWNPKDLASVDESFVDTHFAHLGPLELMI